MSDYQIGIRTSLRLTEAERSLIRITQSTIENRGALSVRSAVAHCDYYWANGEFAFSKSNINPIGTDEPFGTNDYIVLPAMSHLPFTARIPGDFAGIPEDIDLKRTVCQIDNAWTFRRNSEKLDLVASFRDTAQPDNDHDIKVTIRNIGRKEFNGVIPVLCLETERQYTFDRVQLITRFVPYYHLYVQARYTNGRQVIIQPNQSVDGIVSLANPGFGPITYILSHLRERSHPRPGRVSNLSYECWIR